MLHISNEGLWRNYVALRDLPERTADQETRMQLYIDECVQRGLLPNPHEVSRH